MTSLNAHEMMNQAKLEVQAQDWRGEEWGGDFRPAYYAFVKALNEEARLSEKGAKFTAQRITDLLRGVSRLLKIASAPLI